MKREEVISGLLRLSSESPPPPGWQKPYFYLLGSQNLVLLDAGYREQNTVDKIQRVLEHTSRRLKTLVLTHGHMDHAGPIEELSKNFSPLIMASEAERPVLERRNLARFIDQWFKDDVRIESELGELEIISTPGHSPGHVCAYLPAHEILFTGDLVVGEGTSFVGPPDGDMAAYMQSLERIKKLKTRLMLPGHGPAVNDPAKHLGELIKHRELREYQVLQILSQGPGTPHELAQKIYTGLIHPNLYRVAEITVLGHLSKLEQEAKVRSVLDGDSKKYFLQP